MSKLIERIFVLLFETISPMILGLCVYLLFAEVIPRHNWLLWLWWLLLTAWHGTITVLGAIDHLGKTAEEKDDVI